MKMRILVGLILSLVFALSAMAQTSPLTAGSVAPDFTANGMDGAPFELGAVKGNVVLLTFWSTHCEVCRSEIPKLNGFTSRYNGKVLFVAPTLENESRVTSYLSGNPFEFRILPNSLNVFLEYADRDKNGNMNMAFPAYFLIDQSGNIAYRGYGWDKTQEIDSRIVSLLNKK